MSGLKGIDIHIQYGKPKEKDMQDIEKAAIAAANNLAQANGSDKARGYEFSRDIEPGEPAQPVVSVTSAFELLQDENDRLKGIIENLATRLGPALRQGKDFELPSHESAYSNSIARGIGNASHDLRISCELLVEMLNRVDL